MKSWTAIRPREEGRRCLTMCQKTACRMVKSGYGLALIDEQMTLSSELITKPVADAAGTANTAFVHHR